MFELSTPLIIGFLGSLHCLGMCGPLVVAYSLHMQAAHPPEPGHVWRWGMAHHAAFHAGRLLTYSLLGALAAALFHAADLSMMLFHLGGGITIAGGVLLLFLGLVLLRLLPLPAFLAVTPTAPGSILGHHMPQLLRSRGLPSRLALGCAAALLPCCLSWAMIVTAAATRNPLRGAVSMALFGLGTIPALALVGISSSLISLKVRLMGERLAGLSVIATGGVLILRGCGVVH